MSLARLTFGKDEAHVHMFTNATVQNRMGLGRILHLTLGVSAYHPACDCFDFYQRRALKHNNHKPFDALDEYVNKGNVKHCFFAVSLTLRGDKATRTGMLAHAEG